MAIKGRKRKEGKRTKTGRLSRAGLPTRDRGTDRIQDKQSIYGTDGTDAIGRAYRMGLLGEDADNLLIAARRMALDYWPMLGHGVEKCALGDRTGGKFYEMDTDATKRVIERERRLKSNLEYINRMGRNVRRAFDGLVIDINPDCGPVWLDRIIAHEGRAEDYTSLRLALSALAEIAGSKVPRRLSIDALRKVA